MKRSLYIILLAFPLLVTSCLIEEKEVFDKTPAERMDAFLQEYKTLLESNENGWLFEYYPETNQSYGGYNYVLKFKDGNVTAYLELADKEEVSTYKMTQDDGPVLSFDTYNANLHFFAEPSASQYQGLQGDYEYRLLGKSEDGSEVYVQGRKSGNLLTLRKFDGADPYAYFEASAAVYDAISAAKYDMTFDGKAALKCSLANLHFSFSFEKKPATELAPAEIDTYDVAYCYTDQGIRFYETIEVDGTAYDALYLDGETLKSEDGKIVIVKGKIVIEDLIGSYSYTALSAVSGSKLSGSMVLELSDNPEKGNLMFTTLFDTPCEWNVYADLDVEAGVLSVASHQLYSKNNTYLFGIAAIASNGAALTTPMTFTVNVGEFSGTGFIGDCAYNPANGAYIGYFDVLYNFIATRVGQ